MHCEAEQEQCRGVLVSDKAVEGTPRGGQHRVVRRLVSLCGRLESLGQFPEDY